MHNILERMVVNCDLPGAKMIPVSQWILAESCSRQVDIVAMDDKREMIVLLGISADGQILPPQLIYAGKTDRYHPFTNVPDGWNVTHSSNPWSTETTILQYCMSMQSSFLT